MIFLIMKYSNLRTGKEIFQIGNQLVLPYQNG